MCSGPKNTPNLTPHTPLSDHLFKSYADFLTSTFLGHPVVYVHLVFIFGLDFPLKIQTPLTRAAMVSHELSNEIKVPR